MKTLLVLTLLCSGLVISCGAKKPIEDIVKPQPPVIIVPKPPEAPVPAPQLKGTWKIIATDFGPCPSKPVNPCEIGKEASGHDSSGGCYKWKCQ